MTLYNNILSIITIVIDDDDVDDGDDYFLTHCSYLHLSSTCLRTHSSNYLSNDYSIGFMMIMIMMAMRDKVIESAITMTLRMTKRCDTRELRSVVSGRSGHRRQTPRSHAQPLQRESSYTL